MRAAVESGYIGRSACVGVRLPRVRRREMLFLPAGQVRALAEAAGEYRTLIYVLAYGGLRRGEAAALRRKNVDLLRGGIQVSSYVVKVSRTTSSIIWR